MVNMVNIIPAKYQYVSIVNASMLALKHLVAQIIALPKYSPEESRMSVVLFIISISSYKGH